MSSPKTYDTDMAVEIGIDAARILRDLFYYVDKHRSTGAAFSQGRYWTYDSLAAFAKRYPEIRSERSAVRDVDAPGAPSAAQLSEEGLNGRKQKIGRILRDLKGCGYIVIEKKGHDRSNWYTLTPHAYGVALRHHWDIIGSATMLALAEDGAFETTKISDAEVARRLGLPYGESDAARDPLGPIWGPVRDRQENDGKAGENSEAPACGNLRDGDNTWFMNEPCNCQNRQMHLSDSANVKFTNEPASFIHEPPKFTNEPPYIFSKKVGEKVGEKREEGEKEKKEKGETPFADSDKCEPDFRSLYDPTGTLPTPEDTSRPDHIRSGEPRSLADLAHERLAQLAARREEKLRQQPRVPDPEPQDDTSRADAPAGGLMEALPAEIGSEDMATAALLSDTMLDSADDGHYTIVFPEGAGFQKRVAPDGEYAELIRHTLEEIVGHRVSLAFRMAAGDKTTAPKAPPAHERAAESDTARAGMTTPRENTARNVGTMRHKDGKASRLDDETLMHTLRTPEFNEFIRLQLKDSKSVSAAAPAIAAAWEKALERGYDAGEILRAWKAYVKAHLADNGGRPNPRYAKSAKTFLEDFSGLELYARGDGAESLEPTKAEIEHERREEAKRRKLADVKNLIGMRPEAFEWPDATLCPNCGAVAPGISHNGLYTCSECDLTFEPPHPEWGISSDRESKASFVRRFGLDDYVTGRLSDDEDEGNRAEEKETPDGNQLK